jgi:hypothetical protein
MECRSQPAGAPFSLAVTTEKASPLSELPSVKVIVALNDDPSPLSLIDVLDVAFIALWHASISNAAVQIRLL